MKPVDQTMFGDGSNGNPPGDCFRACIASLMELPIEGVPHFVAIGDSWSTCQAWLAERGLAYTEAAPRDAYGLLHIAGVHYLACGPSARGFQHAVIERRGQLAHDPHPSRAGLVETQRLGVLVALHPERFAP